MTSTTKLRIKTASFELDYEGSEEFLKNELLKHIEIATAAPTSARGNIVLRDGDGGRALDSALSLRSVAAKLEVKTGSDLLYAAAGRLVLFGGNDRARRQELLDEMKTATGYYKTTMSNNLSKYLATLLREGKLIELQPEIYTLSAAAAADFKRVFSPATTT